MSSLSSGRYLIQNGDILAGRNRVEDKSLRPKGVFCPRDFVEESVDSGDAVSAFHVTLVVQSVLTPACVEFCSG